MKALLLVTVLACACCGAPPAQGQTKAERTGGIVSGDRMVKCSTGADEKMHCETRSVIELADEIAKTEMVRLREKSETAQQSEEHADYIVMTGLDYQRLVQVLQLLTNALEQRNAEILRLALKFKETCP